MIVARRSPFGKGVRIQRTLYLLTYRGRPDWTQQPPDPRME